MSSPSTEDSQRVRLVPDAGPASRPPSSGSGNVADAGHDESPNRQSSRFEYDVAVVPGKRLGRHSYSEVRLQETLDAHARAGWQLRFITEEPDRLLVTFERPV